MVISFSKDIRYELRNPSILAVTDPEIPQLHISELELKYVWLLRTFVAQPT